MTDNNETNDESKAADIEGWILPDRFVQWFFQDDPRKKTSLMDATDVGVTLLIVGAYVIGWISWQFALISVVITLIAVVGTRLAFRAALKGGLPDGVDADWLTEGDE